MKNATIYFFHLLLFFLFTATITTAQDWEQFFPDTTTSGWPKEAKGFDVVEASDGGYVMCGEVDWLTGAIRHYIRLVKTDAMGNILWEHTYNEGNIFLEQGRALVETPDNGFMIAGANFEGNAQILRTDANGDSLWTKTYELNWTQTVHALIPNPTNNGYLMAGGLVTTLPNGEHALWVLSLNASGDTLWSKTYSQGALPLTEAYDITPTADDHFLIVGVRNSAEAVLIKIDTLGNEVWTEIIQWSKSDAGLAVQEMTNGDILLGGYGTGFAGNSPLLLRRSNTGDPVDEIFIDVVNFGAISDIQATSDGGYILTGSGFDFWNYVTGDHGFLQKLNADLEEEWQILLDTLTYGTAVKPTSDGGVIMSGFYNEGMFLKKVGGGIIDSNQEVYNSDFTAEVYPNPVMEKLIVELPEEVVGRVLQMQVYDLSGRMVLAIAIVEGIEVIDVGHLPQGGYAYIITEAGKTLLSGILAIGN